MSHKAVYELNAVGDQTVKLRSGDRNSSCDRRRQAQVGRRGIGDAPIFFVPAIVIRLARLGQKLEAIEGSPLVVRRMDVSPVQRIGALGLAVFSAVREKFSCEQNFS